jgi:hypothetical protein
MGLGVGVAVAVEEAIVDGVGREKNKSESESQSSTRPAGNHNGTVFNLVRFGFANIGKIRIELADAQPYMYQLDNF